MYRFATLVVALALVPIAYATPSSNANSALSSSQLEGKIAYVRITKFTKEMSRTIRPLMQQIAASKARGFVIDLRDNQGGDLNAVHQLLQCFLPKGTPYMRVIGPTRTLQVTSEVPVVKRSTPVVVLRNAGTGNEADIPVYVLQKLRKAGIVEFSPHRSSLVRKYKQHSNMDDYRPIKDAVFFVTPDARIIADQGGGEEDVIPRAMSMVREMSPWDERTVGSK